MFCREEEEPYWWGRQKPSRYLHTEEMKKEVREMGNAIKRSVAY